MRTQCTLPDCSELAVARGFCSSHWHKWRAKNAGPLPPKPRSINRPACSLPGCDAIATGLGHCRAHWMELDYLPSRPACAIDGCAAPAVKRSWCGTHYAQWQRKGDPLYREEWEPIEDRFVRYADGYPDRAVCWLWTGPCDPAGYGWLSTGGRGNKTMAHRWAYEHFRAPIPEGHQICHNCPGGDNKACVNPFHAFAGTQAENLRDAGEKGLMRWGETHHAAKLTEADIRKMRAARTAGASLGAIARAFGVSHANVSLIVRRKAWRHVE